MRKKYYIISLILLLGFLFIPSAIYACGTKSAKSCCKKEISVKPTVKECCKNGESDSKDKCCEGKCGTESCGCVVTNTISASFIFIQSKFEIIFNFLTIEKVNSKYATPSLSAGYSSIWLIPKIS